MDKDNSGRLSLDAFMQLMANKMAEKDTKEEIMKVFHYNFIRNTHKHIFDTKRLQLLESDFRQRIYYDSWQISALWVEWLCGWLMLKGDRSFFLDTIYTDSKKEKGILLPIGKQLH